MKSPHDLDGSSLVKIHLQILIHSVIADIDSALGNYSAPLLFYVNELASDIYADLVLGSQRRCQLENTDLIELYLL